MIKKLNSYYHLVIPLLIIFLTTRSNLFIGNISGICNNIHYYLLTILLGLGITKLYFNIIKKAINDRIAIIFSLTIIIVTSFPYFDNIIIKNIHVLLAYLGFCYINIIIYHLIKKTQLHKIETFFFALLMVIALLFTVMMVINNLIEMIYLLGIYFIALMIKKKLSLN